MSRVQNEIEYVKALFYSYSGRMDQLTEEVLREGIGIVPAMLPKISENLEMINEYGWFDAENMRIMFNETTIELMEFDRL